MLFLPAEMEVTHETEQMTFTFYSVRSVRKVAAKTRDAPLSVFTAHLYLNFINIYNLIFVGLANFVI